MERHKWHFPFVVVGIVILLIILGVSGVFTPDYMLSIDGGTTNAEIFGSGDIYVSIRNDGKKVALAEKIEISATGELIKTTSQKWNGPDIQPGLSASGSVHIEASGTGKGKITITVYYDGVYQASK
jgi:hypothetical protein